MKYRISDIPEGTSRRQHVVDAGTFELDDAEHDNINLDITFIRESDTIRVQFTASTGLTLICDRSLEKFSRETTYEYEVLFKINAEKTEDSRIAVRPLNVSKNLIDIEEEVRDSILLSIPLKKLHPRYITDTGEATDFQASYGPDLEDEDEKPVDPRWDALKKLKDNQKN